MERRLKEISMHLLDLGKKNRLLNYKETGYRTIQIINQEVETIFEKIVNGNTLSIYQLDASLKKYKQTIDGTEEQILDYTPQKVWDITKSVIKATDIVCYKKGFSLEKVLKIIFKEYQSMNIEKGINPLYMTFGQVEYEEKNQKYYAPLLLIPLSMKVEKSCYKIKEYEDEIILNPTLSYLLRTEYKLSLDEYIEEQDNFGSYFSKVKAQLEKHGLKLLLHMSLGIFSFLKMNMYNDLMNHKEIILKNNNILRMLDQQISETNLCQGKVYPIVDCDSSQLKAIEYAASGASFVLQGPPGSGKSQTITNMIATMLGNGKKVLFVSEKQAALNVVYENLRRAGIESFALELHSHKANKKDFINELYKTATLPKYDIQNEIEFIEFQYELNKEKLEEYRKVLHQIIPRLGFSIYEVYSNYLECKNPGFRLPIPQIDTLGRKELEERVRWIKDYEALTFSLNCNYRDSPFYGFSCSDLSYIRYEAKEHLKALAIFLKNKVDLQKTINQLLPLHIINYQDLLKAIDVVEKIVHLNLFVPSYFVERQKINLYTHLEAYLEASNYVQKSTISNFFDLAILNQDITTIYYQFKRYKMSLFNFLKPRYHKVKKSIQLYAKIKMKDEDILLKLEELLEYKKYLEQQQNSLSMLPNNYRPFEYELMYQDLISLKEEHIELSLDEKSYQALKVQLVDILIHFKENNAFPLHEVASKFDASIMNLVTDDLSGLYSRIMSMNQHLDSLDVYAQLLQIIEVLRQNDLMTYIDNAIKANLEIKQYASGYQYLFYEAIIFKEVDKHPILKEFSGLGVENRIEEFKKVDCLHLDTNKALIISKLSKLRPDDSILAGSKFSNLVKEYNKSRKQKPIRVLLEEIMDFILDIKPVFLMSPLSVSTYLNSSLGMFDLVIFDEASQVFTWDALGSIYRAKQCIIIGDSKQMPPSSFFTSVAEEDQEDYENDLESILDKGTTVFTTKQLSWHYRSRSEELIAFSNKAFYDGRLITLPQAKKHEEGFGIDFYPLKDGIYDVKSRTNLREAQFIVELIVRHYTLNKNQSLGVVAFSNAQAELIDALLERKISEQPELSYILNQECKEPFFIKNLESVQGDERDRIIFSICYGYNENQKFYQRFGPLNNVGGERRLNVAITRAKYNICIVSSILAKDIRLDNTESVGVRLLKEYLDYAEHITLPKKEEFSSNDGVLNSVAGFLESQGFLIQKQVGNSSFKIDIAVLNPATKEYVLAIMLDGPSYTVGNCSDVNRLQEMLLKRLGWQYYRIFSTLWINAMTLEKEKLLNYVNQIFEQPSSVSSQPVTQPKIQLLVEDEDTFDDSFEPYPLVTEEEIKKLYQNKSLPELILYIVKKEEPIHSEYLLRRICFAYGRTKVTNIVKNLFLKDLESINILQESNFLMTKHCQEQSLRIPSDRIIDFVYPKELEDAIYKIVKRNNGITKEGCYKAIAKLLGYQRMSDNAIAYLENALVFLKLDGKIIEKNDSLYI